MGHQSFESIQAMLEDAREELRIAQQLAQDAEVEYHDAMNEEVRAASAVEHLEAELATFDPQDDWQDDSRNEEE